MFNSQREITNIAVERNLEYSIICILRIDKICVHGVKKMTIAISASQIRVMVIFLPREVID